MDRTSLAKRLFAESLKAADASGTKTIKAEAGSLLETATSAGRSKTATRRAVKLSTNLALASKTAGKALAARRPLSEFADDMVKLLGKSSQRAASELRRAALLLRIERLQALAAEDITVLFLGLKQPQAETLGALFGHQWGSAFRPASPELRSAAQQRAYRISETIERIWNQARQRTIERDQTLENALQGLKAAMKKNAELSPGKYMRKRLFDPWRKRFMEDLFADKEFLTLLESETGIQVIESAAGTPSFALKIRVGDVDQVIGMDIDHAEEGLAIAARDALTSGPQALLPIVEGRALQFTTPRENEILLEFFRNKERLAEHEATYAARKMSPPDWEQYRLGLDEGIANLERLAGWSQL